MRSPDIAKWIRSGLLALPLYGVLTFWSSLDPQPDPNTDYEAWARFVTTDRYVLTHVLGSILGLILSIFGTFALGASDPSIMKRTPMVPRKPSCPSLGPTTFTPPAAASIPALFRRIVVLPEIVTAATARVKVFTGQICPIKHAPTR